MAVAKNHVRFLRVAEVAVGTEPGSDHPSDVLSCSAFGKPYDVRCQKACLDLAETHSVSTALLPRYSLIAGGTAYPGSAVEMPGLWKAWKAKSRLPTLSTSPLEISPKAGEIPTLPQRRRRRRMEKWKTKSRFSTFPPPRILSL